MGPPLGKGGMGLHRWGKGARGDGAGQAPCQVGLAGPLPGGLIVRPARSSPQERVCVGILFE